MNISYRSCSATRFRVIERDPSDNSYLLQGLDMHFGVLTNVVWATCKKELRENRIYHGELSQHPGREIMLRLPEFYVKTHVKNR